MHRPALVWLRAHRDADATVWLGWQQENCDDCGVFTCMFIGHLTVGQASDFKFRQTDIDDIRDYLAWVVARPHRPLPTPCTRPASSPSRVRPRALSLFMHHTRVAMRARLLSRTSRLSRRRFLPGRTSLKKVKERAHSERRRKWPPTVMIRTWKCGKKSLYLERNTNPRPRI